MYTEFTFNRMNPSLIQLSFSILGKTELTVVGLRCRRGLRSPSSGRPLRPRHTAQHPGVSGGQPDFSSRICLFVLIY